MINIVKAEIVSPDKKHSKDYFLQGAIGGIFDLGDCQTLDARTPNAPGSNV